MMSIIIVGVSVSWWWDTHDKKHVY